MERGLMNKITVVGMGPGGINYLTMEAYNILTQSGIVYLRTERHPVVNELVAKGMKYESFDALYDAFETFDEVYESIANKVIEMAQIEPVIYAVPGNPFVAEKTVSLILERAASAVEVVHGTSFIDAIVTALRYDPVYGFVILDALSIEREQVNTRKDHLFIQVYDQLSASMLKLKLMDVWHDDHMVTVIKAAGIPDEEVIESMPLYQLDHDSELFNHLTSVFVPHGKSVKHQMIELEEIMRTLRSDNGCPWDREQTHESLTPYLVEEAYEVRDAVLKGDDESLVDELGDVLLQVVFHATIAEENGYFELSDIIKAVCEKMIRRHPHVFGDVVVNGSEEVLINWQAIKDEEKSALSISERMKAVTRHLPSLIRSQKVQKKAAEVGFDWNHAMDAMEKIEEETMELKKAIISGDKISIEEELGDLLLIVSNVSRILNVDSELALMNAIEKFIDRFDYVEKKLEEEGISPNPLVRERMEDLWCTSKKRDKL
jgi:tetrapyrrole methylase family protein/MazG family protein